MLLDKDEPPAFEVVRPQGASQFVLLCDHASKRLPRALGSMGLSPAQLEEHIAWDIGAAQLARRMSESLDAPLVLSGYSRLAIDCNRPLGAATSIPAVTCDVRVPGNEAVSDAERDARAAELFWPYHRAIETLLEARGDSIASVILSMHSFTPSMNGRARPWHIGVMYGRDRRLAAALLSELAREELVVGDNEPYRVTDGTDYGVPVYAERAHRLGVLIEVRQDLLATSSGVDNMFSILTPALQRVLAGLGSC